MTTRAVHRSDRLKPSRSGTCAKRECCVSEDLEIAVTAWRFGTGGVGSELAAQAEIAESMGFHSFWLPENHFGGAASIPSPLMLLAGVASRTSRIRLGSTSYLLPIRHPIAAAEEVAVLDRMSDGRVILGVGRGFQPAMFTAFGVDPKEKRKRFKANLTLMIDAWQGRPVASHEGEDVILAPLPVQQPHPPIWVAAFGPLALKQAGGLGLPYLASPVETLASLEANYARHREAFVDAGHAGDVAVPVMRTLFVSDRSARVEAVKDVLAGEARHRMREAEPDPDDWTIVGDHSYVKDKLVEYRESVGLTHLIARGRITGVDDEEQLASLESLRTLAADV